MIDQLPDAEGTVEPEPFAGVDHPMRKVTRQVAFDGKWDAERAAKIATLFDGLAPEWANERVTDLKFAPIRDALERGGAPLAGRWLELGSGTGAGTEILVERGADVVVLDLSAEMLSHAADVTPKIRSDASAMPFADDRFDALLMVNMLLFPREVDRVLKPDGVVVWVNTAGDQTPIHLPAADVAEALPGSWVGTTARAGAGIWATLRRA
ncbi:MAG: class I SAM-dependent methyltransferase, partial [Actinomycetota bacterium]|nr:class I SAM-dependent methyltransferase [Actinomycetota bacterium]